MPEGAATALFTDHTVLAARETRWRSPLQLSIAFQSCVMRRWFVVSSVQAACVAFLLVPADHVGALDCLVSTNERIVQVVCGPVETCCGLQCCVTTGHFYTHWYFWLAVSMLLFVVIIFAVSACRHFRKERMLGRHLWTNSKPVIRHNYWRNCHTLTETSPSPVLLDIDLEVPGASSSDSEQMCTEILPPPYPHQRSNSSASINTAGSDYSHLPPSYSEHSQLPPSYSEVMLHTLPDDNTGIKPLPPDSWNVTQI